MSAVALHFPEKGRNRKTAVSGGKIPHNTHSPTTRVRITPACLPFKQCIFLQSVLHRAIDGSIQILASQL